MSDAGSLLTEGEISVSYWEQRRRRQLGLGPLEQFHKPELERRGSGSMSQTLMVLSKI